MHTESMSTPRILVRFFIVAILLSSLIFSLSPIAHAQTSSSYPTNYSPNLDPNVPHDLHTLTQSMVIEAMDALSCVITGQEFINKSEPCLGVNPQTGKIGYAPAGGGILQIEGSMISMLYTSPASTGDYIQYLSNNFIGNKKAYAQATGNGTGLGFQGITPILGVWSAFRNIVYLLFVVFFVLLGLGIMFRVKIDPKTELNIQNAIPKVVIALILVTFSFAISGFLIDMMYLLTYFVVTIMQTGDPSVPATWHAGTYPQTGINSQFVFSILNRTPMGFTDELYHGQNPLAFGIWGIVSAATGTVSLVITNAVRELVANNGFLSVLLGIFSPGCWTYQTLGIGPINATLPDPGNTDWAHAAGCTVGWLTYAFVWLALYIALIIALFRLWFAMLKAYVLILIDISLSPFYIALNLFPGSGIGVETWLRGMIANLAFFPAAVFMFLLAKIFIDKFSIINGSYFVAPLLGNITNPDPNTGQTAIGAIIGFGIILLTPTMIDQLRDKLGTKPNPYYGKALGTYVGAGAAIAGAAAVGPLRRAFRAPGYGQDEGFGRRLIFGNPGYTPQNPDYKHNWINRARYRARNIAYQLGMKRDQGLGG